MTWILPVKIETIELVFLQEFHRPGNKLGPLLAVRRHLAVLLAAFIPAPDGDHHLEVAPSVPQVSRLPEPGQPVVGLQVHPGVERLDAGLGRVQPSKAVDEVGTEASVYTLRGELALDRPVVGPGAPVADHHLVVAGDRVGVVVGVTLRVSVSVVDQLAHHLVTQQDC